MVWGEERTVADMLSSDLRGSKGRLVEGVIAKRVEEYAFATRAELDAFVLGVEASEGWLNAYLGDTREDAVDYLRQVAQNYVEGFRDGGKK